MGGDNLRGHQRGGLVTGSEDLNRFPFLLLLFIQYRVSSNSPPNVRKYSQKERQDGSGKAYFLLISFLLLTIMLVLGLFLLPHKGMQVKVVVASSGNAAQPEQAPFTFQKKLYSSSCPGLANASGNWLQYFFSAAKSPKASLAVNAS